MQILGFQISLPTRRAPSRSVRLAVMSNQELDATLRLPAIATGKILGRPSYAEIKSGSSA
jgi:hypothetical protein